MAADVLIARIRHVLILYSFVVWLLRTLLRTARFPLLLDPERHVAQVPAHLAIFPAVGAG